MYAVHSPRNVLIAILASLLFTFLLLLRLILTNSRPLARHVTFNAWISSVIARVGLDEFLQITDLTNFFNSRPTRRMNWALIVLSLCQLAQLWFLFKFNREYNHLDGLGCEGNENYEGMGSRVTWMSVLCLLTSNSARCYSI